MNLCPNLSPELWIFSSDCQLDVSILINSEQLKLHIGKRKFLIVPPAQPEAAPPAILPSSVNDKFTFHLAQVACVVCPDGLAMELFQEKKQGAFLPENTSACTCLLSDISPCQLSLLYAQLRPAVFWKRELKGITIAPFFIHLFNVSYPNWFTILSDCLQRDPESNHFSVPPQWPLSQSPLSHLC